MDTSFKQNTTSKSVSVRKIIVKILLLAAILFFFFTFFSVSCHKSNDERSYTIEIANATGFQLMLGTDWSQPKLRENDLPDTLKDSKKEDIIEDYEKEWKRFRDDDDSDDIDVLKNVQTPDPFLVVVFLCAVLSFCFSFAKDKKFEYGIFALSGIAVLSLIVFVITVRNRYLYVVPELDLSSKYSILLTICFPVWLEFAFFALSAILTLKPVAAHFDHAGSVKEKSSADSIICDTCGAKISIGKKFCSKCGAAVQISTIHAVPAFAENNLSEEDEKPNEEIETEATEGEPSAEETTTKPKSRLRSTVKKAPVTGAASDKSDHDNTKSSTANDFFHQAGDL